MNTLEDLSDALQTTGDIQSIVRTMKALSSVSIRQYERAEAAMADYARAMDRGLAAVMRQSGQAGLASPGTSAATGRRALIVIGSDRGLCGGYNDRITRFARARMGMDSPPAVLGVIGARAADRLAAGGWRADALFTLPGSVEGLSRLVQAVIVTLEGWTRRDAVGQVWLMHNRRAGRANARAQAQRLLPLSEAYLQELSRAPWPGRSLPLIRMAPERLMSWLVQQRLFVLLYRALAEAQASEHASRLAAMQAAERNIKARRDELLQLYRTRRQEAITGELLDLVSGFEAVSTAE